jgi:hypothetical protein
MQIATIDFEASCLPRHGRSYPIEVGITDTEWGTRTWLIRPHVDWAGWDWTAEAESLHGLTRDWVLLDGQDATLVARELEHALSGRRVIADSHIDAYWLETLLKAAGVVPFARIKHVETLFAEFNSTDDEIRAAQSDVDCLGLRRHRAGDDAKWLYLFAEAIALSAANRGHRAERSHTKWDIGSGQTFAAAPG